MKFDATIKPMIINSKMEQIHHMVNVAITTYRAVCDAKYEWVRWCDDDDTWMADTRTLLAHYAKDNVGFIHGNVVCGDVERLGGEVFLPWDCYTKFIGSGNIFNRDAFHCVSDAIIKSAHLCESAFLDWRMAYWLLLAGWKGVYVNRVFGTQGVDNTSLQRSNTHYVTRRQRWVRKWALVIREMEEGNYKRFLRHEGG